uniref:COesterase domain-containing protein n=1 Tax=Angiostrongylus cantonensis TaxID=6313 RepID=A0A0K0D6F3_ANGCA
MEAQPPSRIEVGIQPRKGFHSSQSGNLLFVPNFDGDFFPKPMDELRRESPRKQIMLLGDYAITVGVMRYVQKMTEYGNEVYFYCFEYYNPDGFGVFRFLLPFKGATHCSEIRYILGKGVFSKFKPSNNDLKMLDMMTDFFTNFAKNG